MALDRGKADRAYQLEDIELPLDVERRLESLGMTRETEIRVLSNKDDGILIVKVQGARFVLGKGISKNLRASLLTQGD